MQRERDEWLNEKWRRRSEEKACTSLTLSLPSCSSLNIHPLQPPKIWGWCGSVISLLFFHWLISRFLFISLQISQVRSEEKEPNRLSNLPEFLCFQRVKLIINKGKERTLCLIINFALLQQEMKGDELFCVRRYEERTVRSFFTYVLLFIIFFTTPFISFFLSVHFTHSFLSFVNEQNRKKRTNLYLTLMVWL